MNLRFNTDAGRSVLQILRTSRENIESEIQRALSQAQNLVPGDWEAPAANEFEGEANEWGNIARQSQERLEELANKLDREIIEWEEAAARLQ